MSELSNPSAPCPVPALPGRGVLEGTTESHPPHRTSPSQLLGPPGSAAQQDGDPRCVDHLKILTDTPSPVHKENPEDELASRRKGPTCRSCPCVLPDKVPPIPGCNHAWPWFGGMCLSPGCREHCSGRKSREAPFSACRGSAGMSHRAGWRRLGRGMGRAGWGGLSVLAEHQLSGLALPPLEGKSEIESEPWQGQPSGEEPHSAFRRAESPGNSQGPPQPPPAVIQLTFSLVSFRL